MVGLWLPFFVLSIVFYSQGTASLGAVFLSLGITFLIISRVFLKKNKSNKKSNP